ncbi:hypothetical protein K0B04_03980 [Patescibacteria group bacterium]|nr:hypothetical protein [Patescibacteria group bacterium]
MPARKLSFSVDDGVLVRKIVLTEVKYSNNNYTVLYYSNPPLIGGTNPIRTPEDAKYVIEVLHAVCTRFLEENLPESECTGGFELIKVSEEHITLRRKNKRETSKDASLFFFLIRKPRMSEVTGAGVTNEIRG